MFCGCGYTVWRCADNVSHARYQYNSFYQQFYQYGVVLPSYTPFNTNSKMLNNTKNNCDNSYTFDGSVLLTSFKNICNGPRLCDEDFKSWYCCNSILHNCISVQDLRPANERRRYKVTPSLIGCAQVNRVWNRLQVMSSVITGIPHVELRGFTVTTTGNQVSRIVSCRIGINPSCAETAIFRDS